MRGLIHARGEFVEAAGQRGQVGIGLFRRIAQRLEAFSGGAEALRQGADLVELVEHAADVAQPLPGGGQGDAGVSHEFNLPGEFIGAAVEIVEGLASGAVAVGNGGGAFLGRVFGFLQPRLELGVIQRQADD